MTLREKIEQEIRERGPMAFSRYMEMCLYDPFHGYYSRNAEQFGKAGDFYTASDVHAVFGRLIARRLEGMWRELGSPGQIEILELGPGRGLFARDVLDWSRKKWPGFFAAVAYTLQEESPALRAKLKETLARHIATGKANLSTGTSPLETERAASQAARSFAPIEKTALSLVQNRLPSATPRIIFANEFFDALPVEIVSEYGKLHLAVDGNRLREIWLPPGDAELEFLDRYGIHPEPGERVEVPLIAQRWMKAAAASTPRGYLIVIDYGYARAEQLAGHHRGTLMSFREHSASPNPYPTPGEQDITAHVNFTALAAAAEDSGMQVEPLRTQSQFLMGIGEANEFADAFEDCRLPYERAKVALQLKHLITPEGMGETFRVLIARRGIN